MGGVTFAYEELISNDEDALKYALKPGISRIFTPGGINSSNDEWANSGYGLYMISRICANLGSFIIASGDSVIKTDRYGQKVYPSLCHIQGTAIRLRVYLSKMGNYEDVAQRLLRVGEKEATANGKAIPSASKSTRSILGYEE